MKVTVGIPVYNNAATLGRVLDAVLAQTRAPDEIIVADDGSRDGSAAEAGSRNVRVITHNRNLGLAEARNTILRNAGGDVIVYFDADAAPRSDCIEKLLESYKEKSVGAAGGRGLEGGLSNKAQKWRARVTPQDHGDAPIPNDWMLMGLCCSFRRKALESVGGFDSSFERAGEDVDVCLRLRRAGWRLAYEPEAVVEHIPGGNALDISLQAFEHAKFASYALNKNGEIGLDYIVDTYRHLVQTTVRDIQDRHWSDAALGAANMTVRAAGIVLGALRARTDILLNRRRK